MKNLPNILIVDDLNENLKFLGYIMRNVRANLIEALSGEEALEKVVGVELALAVIDVRMPVMNGYELARKLNEDKLEDKVPVIFLTANFINETDLLSGYSSGAVDYINKPFKNHIFLSKVSIFLDLFHQKQKVVDFAAHLQETADELSRVNAALRQSEERHRRGMSAFILKQKASSPAAEWLIRHKNVPTCKG